MRRRSRALRGRCATDLETGVGGVARRGTATRAAAPEARSHAKESAPSSACGDGRAGDPLRAGRTPRRYLTNAPMRAVAASHVVAAARCELFARTLLDRHCPRGRAAGERRGDQAQSLRASGSGRGRSRIRRPCSAYRPGAAARDWEGRARPSSGPCAKPILESVPGRGPWRADATRAASQAAGVQAAAGAIMRALCLTFEN